MVVAAPFTLIAYRGVVYLRATFRSLENPGKPFEVSYRAQTGEVVTLYADRYNLDVNRGYVRVDGPRVVDTSGAVVARLDFIDVRGLKWRNLGDQVVRVRGSGLTAKLTRLRDGQFDLTQLLPEKKGPPSKIPFEVELERAQVELVDLMGDRPWSQRLSTPRLTVAGMGDDWVANTRIAAAGIGTFPIRIQNVSGFGLQAQTEARNAEVAPVLAHFLRTAPLRDSEYSRLTVRSARVLGPVRVFVPAIDADTYGDPKIETRLTVRAAGIRFKEYALDTAEFTGLTSLVGASGVGEATVGPNRVRFDGSVTWDHGVQIGGRVAARSPRLASLPGWVRKEVPPDVEYRNARYDGWVSYGSPTAYRVSGRVQGDRIDYRKETVSGLDAQVRLAPGRLVANVRRATFAGEPVAGSFALDTNAKALSGAVAVDRVDLGMLARRFGVAGLSGHGSIVASLGGTVARPAVQLEARGDAVFRNQGRSLSGTFDLSGAYAGDSLQLRRALLIGPFGLVAATGQIGNAGDIGIQVTGRDLNAAAIDPSLEGRANLIARISGTASRPVATGYLEAYNLSTKNYLIPAIATDFTVDRHHAELRGLRATRGTAELAGNAAYGFQKGTISGLLKARGLQIADLLGEEFAGAIDIPEAKIGGTLKNPTLEASLSGRNVMAQGLKVDAVSAKLTSDGRVARVEEATASVADGTITGSARLNIERRQGMAEVNVRGIALADVVPKLSTSVAMEGKVGGRAQIDFSTSGISSIDASGRLRGIALNGAAIGDGPWNIGYDGRRYTGSVQVGSLERYISADDLSFDPQTNAVAGQLNLFNSRVEDLVAISSRYLPQLSPETLDALRSTQGTVNLGGSFEGSLDRLAIDVRSLEASDLKYGDVDLGTLTASLRRENAVWNLRTFALAGGAVNATASGTVDEEGKTDVSADIATPSLADLGRIVPQLAGQTGSASLSIIASGATKSPDLRMSLDANGLLRAPNQPEDSALRVSLLGRVAGEEGRLSLDGNYFYKGFQGRIHGFAPFTYQAGIPDNGKTDLAVTVAERELTEVAEFVSGIDAKRTKGKVEGEIHATGSPSNLSIQGGLKLVAETLAFEIPKADPGKGANAVTSALKNVDFGINLANQRVSLVAGAESSNGGRIDANVSTAIPELRTLFNTLQTDGVGALLDSALTGEINLKDFYVRQNFPTAGQQGEALAGLVGGSVSASANGSIAVSGPVKAPHFEGRLALSKVDTEVPTVVGVTGEPSVPAIDPSFDLRMTLASPARIRTTAADLSVLGGGRLTGSLSEPTVRANLQVEKGAITLPASTVRLEQGGTVTFNYEPAPGGGAFAALDVDLEGKTALTAQRFADAYERYEITLGVKGDLLKENGLTLTAQSDPPDLTQDRILALLGHTDLISDVATGGLGQSDTEKRLRNALTSFALPSLTDPITSRLANSIGLAYLNVEYNEFEMASVSFARVLGNGFSIQGRQQIGEPPPGFRPLYDLRLVYRPRRTRGVFSRFSFSIGADQDRPFKIAFEYGTRF